MNLEFQNARWDAERMSDYFCDGNDLFCVYNANNGFIEWGECVVGQAGISTTPVRYLFDCWQNFFEDFSYLDNSKFLQICTSQGVIHVNNALSALPPWLAKRICVLAVTPGIYISPQPGVQVVHFMKMEDHISAHLALGRSRVDKEDEAISKLLVSY